MRETRAARRRLSRRAAKVIRPAGFLPEPAALLKPPSREERIDRRATDGSEEIHESESGPLGKGRLHTHCREHERKRGGTRSETRRHQSLKALDLGCGDGTTALPEARLGAHVLGVDIARNLVEAGNKRAKEAGLANCKFQEGEATDLSDLKDATFDLVVSILGAMFAPKPFDVARGMTRVTRPGGRIVMGNWIPNDPTLVAQILKISSAASPPPPEGFVSPMTWGSREM